MAGYTSSEKINEVQRLTNIVEVINRHVNLKRAGKNFTGLCPFHAEKTPSFSVSPEKQIYKCFGCGEGGTVFTFVMKKEGLSFPEALRVLAKRARVDIPEPGGKEGKSEGRVPLYEVNHLAVEFFHKCLLGEEGKPARDYLQNRGIKESSIKKFRIGLAPDSWDTLVRLAQAKDIPLSRLQSSGLIIAKSGGGGVYDRFRNRLMFPITDYLGRVVGFGGRTLSGSEPKYVNSPETRLFSKGRCLYGLYAAKPSILENRKALIMEGYTDVIVAHQEGISNAVGVLGTALTVEHIRTLRQWTPEVVLVLDGDTAGRKSSDRSLDILAEEEIEARVVQLPEGDDPCEFILRDGADRFKELLGNALDFFSFKVQMVEAKHDVSTASGKLAAIRELLHMVLKIPNELKRQLVVKDIAKKMAVEEDILRREFRNLTPYGIRKTADDEAVVTTGPGVDYRAEKELLGLLLSHNELIEEFEAEVGPKALKTESIREIASKALEIYRKNGHVREVDLIPFFHGDEPARAIADVTFDVERGDYRNRFDDCVYYVKRRESKKKIGDTKERIKTLDSDEKMEEAKLLREFHEKTKLAHLSRKRTQ
ncbi:MAG: DNA primase [Candidatus Brocadiales bacterium]|nr:DNA primase [Candidatus Bathyanammoxibius amoris]